MAVGKFLILSDCSQCSFRRESYCKFLKRKIEKEDMIEYIFGKFPSWCKLKDCD